MKKLLLFFYFIFLLSIIDAQPPQAISYQAVARNNKGDLINNKNISLRFSIHDSSAIGTIIYSETHNANTNTLGLFNLNIGQGTVITGSFSSINWGNGSKFIQVEMYDSIESNFIDMGTQQMMSVPYALFAGKSNSMLTVQERLDAGETPLHIYETGVPLELIYRKNYVGGLIYYLDISTGHGLVVSQIDLSENAPWDNGDHSLIPTPGAAIGDGAGNTSLIVSTHGEGFYAAYLCDTLNLNGFSDWFLPSITESTMLSSLGNLLGIDRYWTSNQYFPYFGQAYYYQPNSFVSNDDKGSFNRVRAVRSF